MAAVPHDRRHPCRGLSACPRAVALPLRGTALPPGASLPRRQCRPPVSGAGRRRHRQRRRRARRAAHLARSVPARQGGRRDAAQGARPHPRLRREIRPSRRRRDAARRRRHRDRAVGGRRRPGVHRSGCALRRQPRRVRAAARRRAPRHRPGQRSGRRTRGRTPRPALRAGGRRRHRHRPRRQRFQRRPRRPGPPALRARLIPLIRCAGGRGERSGGQAHPERGESLWTPSSI